MAERYIEYVKANPQAFLDAEKSYVHETGLRLLRVRDRGVEELQRIPVWKGRATVQNTVSSLGGLGPQAVSWTTPMVNLHVDVVMGERYLAAWSWPGVSGRPEDRAVPLAGVLLDRTTLRFLSPFEGMRPVIWTGPERLLVLRRVNEAWRLALLAVRATPKGAEFELVRSFNEPSFGRPASVFSLSSPVLLPPPPGRDPRFLLFRRGRKGIWLDLDSGRSEAMGRDVRFTPYGVLRLLGPRAWMVSLSGGMWAIAIRDAGGRVVLDRRDRLPSGFPLPMWEGPLAAARGRLLWGRDPGIGRKLGRGAASSSSSNRLELSWFDPQSRTLRPLPLPVIAARPPDGNGRLVAVSPDDRWLAARVSEKEVRIWPLSSLD